MLNKFQAPMYCDTQGNPWMWRGMKSWDVTPTKEPREKMKLEKCQS